jgi:hypothetical protein
MSCIIRSSIEDFERGVNAFLSVASVSRTEVTNLTTTIERVGSGAARIPATLNCSESDNAWVCSPYTAYCRYAIEELHRFDHPWLTLPLSALCRGFGAYLQAQRIDHAVALNNWLLSTNLYPELNVKVLRMWIDEAAQRWPAHAVWFRSLNVRYTQDWLKALRELGCVLIPSRQVYVYDRIRTQDAVPQNLARDLRLLTSTHLTRSDAGAWDAKDFCRAAELYSQLYLQKYSRLNPAYSASFLEAWHRVGLLDLTGYRDDDGVLHAVVGTFSASGIITAPIVGYELAKPRSWSLYRLLMATVYQAAACSGARINLSAGAAEFKRLRGGIGVIEYSAVYVRHLPKARRRAIAMLATLAQRIGEPIMRRFEL